LVLFSDYELFFPRLSYAWVVAWHTAHDERHI
jgi:hypothetical protein